MERKIDYLSIENNIFKILKSEISLHYDKISGYEWAIYITAEEDIFFGLEHLKFLGAKNINKLENKNFTDFPNLFQHTAIINGAGRCVDFLNISFGNLQNHLIIAKIKIGIEEEIEDNFKYLSLEFEVIMEHNIFPNWFNRILASIDSNIT